MIPSPFFVLIFFIPFFTALLIPLFRGQRLIVQTITSIALLGSLISSLYVFTLVKDGQAIHYPMGGWMAPFGIEWRVDSLTALMAILVSAVSLLIILATGATVDKEIGKVRLPYYTVVLLNISGLMGIILTNDFFNLFVFLEVSSLTGYALIASGGHLRGTVSSFRYLLIGTIGASFYLLGVGYLYAATGSLNMTDVAARVQDIISSRTVFLGILFLLIGLAIKMGLFPFHGWLPDAYTYASDSATSLIAPLMTKVMIYSFIRIFFIVLGADFIAKFGILKILITVGSLAVVSGSIMAFMQKDFKRMLAYSSISHIGLIALGLGLNQPIAFVGVILHIINHACMKAALFLTAASASYQHNVRNIVDFVKLRGRMPFTLAVFAMAALSMIGIPPFCGFFSKWYILIGSFEAGHPWIAALIVGSSLLTALYFFKVIEDGFFHHTSSHPQISEGPLALVFSSGLFAVSLLVLGYFAPQIFSWGLHTLPPFGS